MHSIFSYTLVENILIIHNYSVTPNCTGGRMGNFPYHATTFLLIFTKRDISLIEVNSYRQSNEKVVAWYSQNYCGFVRLSSLMGDDSRTKPKQFQEQWRGTKTFFQVGLLLLEGSTPVQLALHILSQRQNFNFGFYPYTDVCQQVILYYFILSRVL